MREVSYTVSDVEEAIPFYTTLLGFRVDMRTACGCVSLSRGDLHLFLSQQGADGQNPASDGCKALQIEVEDLAATVQKLKDVGCTFRNEIVAGYGGKQILVNDPFGNPVELFQPWPEIISLCLMFGILYDIWL